MLLSFVWIPHAGMSVQMLFDKALGYRIIKIEDGFIFYQKRKKRTQYHPEYQIKHTSQLWRKNRLLISLEQAVARSEQETVSGA